MGNWNSSSGTGTTDDAWSSGPGQNYSSTTTSSSTNSGNDNNDSTPTFSGVGIGGFGGAYDPNYGQEKSASESIAETLGMSGYGSFAMNEFGKSASTDETDYLDPQVYTRFDPINFFATPTVTDLSLTRAQVQSGYSVGDSGPNYGMQQLPSSYYESANIFGMGGGLKEGLRVGRTEAKAFADYEGTQFNPTVTTPNLTGFSGFMTRAVDSIGTRFGTSTTKQFAINPQTGFVGEVFDDNSFTDLMGNLIGLNVPGVASVDTAVVKDVTGRGMPTQQYMMSDTLFGKQEKTMNLDDYAKMMAEQATRDAKSQAESNVTTPTSVSAAATAASAPTIRRSSLLKSFLTPMARDYLRQESAFGNAAGLFGAFTFGLKEGGEVDKELLEKMQGDAKKRIDVEGIKKKAAEGGTMASMLLDPNKAKTREDLEQVYAYNDAVFKTYGEMEAMAVGGAAGEPVAENAGGPTGFVEQRPENVSEAATVADDVPLEVPESTFVINAAAVEFAGSEDIKNMILDAIAEAKRQGIDISTDDSKITEENAVSLLVSKGEVIVPPVLAKIIGYDRLNKINDRGKPEVEKRVAENGQSPEAEALDEQPRNPSEDMAMSQGGESLLQQAYKVIPTNVRLLLEYAAGATSPITEKDFTQEELQEMVRVIEKQRGRNTNTENQLRQMAESGLPYRELETPEGFKGLTEFFGESDKVYVDFKGNFVDQKFVDAINNDKEFKDALMKRVNYALGSYENSRDTVTVGGPSYYRSDVNYPAGYEGFVEKLQDPTYQVQTTVGQFKSRDNENLTGYNVTDNYNFNSGELGYDSNEDITLEDIWNSRNQPQQMAELLARYLRPEGNRPVNINIPRDTGGISPTMAAGGKASDGGMQIRNVKSEASTFEDKYSEGKQGYVSGEISGEGFAVRPSANYSETDYSFQLPNGVVVDGNNNNVGMAIDGEVYLDDAAVRAGVSRQTSKNVESASFAGRDVGGTQSSNATTRYSLGGSKGPVSLDYSVMDMGTVDKIRQGRFVYRYSDDGELYLEGDNQGAYRLGFLQRF